MTTYTYLVGTAETYTTLNAAVTAAVSVANINTTNTVDILLKGPNTGGPSKYSPTKMELTGAGTILRAQINVKAYDLTDKPIIDGVGGGNTCFLLNQNYSGASLSSFTTTFQGLKFQNWTTTGAGANEGLIYVGGNGAVNVSDCEFYNCLNTQIVYGINAASPRTSTIERNKFTDTWPGVQIWGNSSTRVIVKNNVFIVTASAGAEVGGAIAAPIGTSGAGAKGGLVYNNSIYWYVGTGVNAASGDLISAHTASNNAAYSVNQITISSQYKMINAGYASNNCLYESVGTPTYLSVTTDGGGNLTASDPKFSSPSGGDLSITKASPCYNAGAQISSVTDSYNGVARPTIITNTLKYDIGAYEYYDVSNASRILNLPVRIMIAERDSMTGSYPTIARTGDPDFSGRYPAYFDDTSAVNFNRGSNVLYPILLPSESKHVYNDIQRTTYFQGIVAPGNVTAGTSDTHIHFTPGQSISAFNESRVYLDNDSAFYATGTSSGTLPGFDQRLSSKTILTFDVNPSTSTNVFFSTGSSASPIGSGLAYYNWEAKKWEMIGITQNGVTTGSNVDFLNPDPAVRSRAPHAFCGIQAFTPSAEYRADFARSVGRPHSTHGFPFATQFDPTGSQVLSMSGSLTGPFMLEKASFEWSGSFHPYQGTNFDKGPLTYNFFLLNITPISDSVAIVQDLTGSSGGTVAKSSTTNFTVNYIKDIVWTGEISRIDSSTWSTDPATYGRDLTLLYPSVPISSVTGTFRVDAIARAPEKNDGMMTHNVRGDTTRAPLLANKIGFRNLAGYVEGKSQIRPVGVSVTSGTSLFSEYNLSTNYQVPRLIELQFSSPYVLLPNHKLILGFSCQPVQGTLSTPSLWSEQSQSTYITTLSPGAGKLTLYGSLLQDGKPKDTELNQPLTSDAIHEDLHYDNPVFDQFDVEPFEAFAGAYIDNIVTGSMLASPIGDPTAANVRKVQARVTLGQAGTTGSLQRFVSIPDTYGTSYDSYPPNPVSIIKKSGVGLLDFNTFGEVFFAVGVPTGNHYVDIHQVLSGVDLSWYQRSAYESENERFTYSTFANQKGLAYYVNNSLIGEEYVKYPDSALVFGPGDDFGYFVVSSDENGTFTGANSLKSTKKWLFGFGDERYNVPTPNKISLGAYGNVVAYPTIRGYKYGLAGLFGSTPDVRFRRDRYGQFRDMLEQRRYPATLLPDGSVEYPIEISFVPQDTGVGSTSPLNTHSQNLSTHATSSVPYFDGVARDRDDDPDVTLSVPVNYTIT